MNEMTNQQALDQFRDFGNAVRPGIILSVCLIAGVMIGKRYDSPVEGLAGGFVVASLANGIINWNTARNNVS